MTATATEEDDSLTDSQVAQWLRLLKLVLTILTLLVTLWKAATGIA